ncbi:SF3a splicing factor complex subunit [Sorochytrium milnesiophthora]
MVSSFADAAQANEHSASDRMQAADGDAPHISDMDLELPDNIILPPPEFRSIVDNTAKYVAKNGVLFEETIRERERDNPKFCFLNTSDVYYPYYSCQLIRFKAGVVKPQELSIAQEEPVAQPAAPVKPAVKPPPAAPAPFEFCLDLPPVSVQDLDIIKLTAQFVACNGRQFMNQLSQRESRNYQFDFLRPSHSLFGYFTKLVEQYKQLVAPPYELTAKLSTNILRRVEQRVEYAKWEEEQRQKAQAEEDAERLAYASIDWHDFVVVQAIEITDVDETAELPPPSTLLELQSMSLVEKRQAFAPPPAATQANQEQDEDMDMEMDMDMESAAPASQAPAPQPKAIGPIKIRTDYVPGQRRTQKAPSEVTQICVVCGQSIPVSEMEEHVRIELLDPKWRVQREAAEAARAESNLNNDDQHIAQAVASFAERRPDLFGSDDADPQKKLLEDQERQREQANKKVIWDGHTNSAAGVLQKVRQYVPVEEQIASIHKSKGLVADPTKVAIGPQPTQPSHDYASYSAGMMPGMVPGMVPGMPMNAYGALPPYGSSMPAQYPLGPPPLPGYPGASGFDQSLAGQVRPYSETDGDDMGSDPKRARNGDLLPEAEWLQQHPEPINLVIVMPNTPDKHPNLNGVNIQLENVDPASTIMQVKTMIADRIDLPAKRQKLTVSANGQTKVSKDNDTLALWNLTSGASLLLGMRERGGVKK